jgi:hypothetical protein
MPLTHLESGGHAETIGAVVVGAVLATLGGVAANQLEAHFRRRDRERTAALLFGELLSGLRVLLEGADRARRVGEPYGPFTLRLLHAARREINIYERNRESLLDLRNAALRVDVHVLMVSIAMPLDGLIESIVSPVGADDRTRDQGFSFIVDCFPALPPLVTRLGRIARHSFEDYQRIPPAGAGAVPASSPAGPGGEAVRGSSARE